MNFLKFHLFQKLFDNQKKIYTLSLHNFYKKEVFMEVSGSSSLLVKRGNSRTENSFTECSLLVKIAVVSLAILAIYDPVTVAARPVTSIAGVDATEFERFVNVTVCNYGKEAACRELGESVVICDQEIVNHADCDKGGELLDAYHVHESSIIAKVRDRLFTGYMPKNEQARNLHAIVGWIKSNQRRLDCSYFKPMTKLQKRPDCHSRHKMSTR